MTVGLGDDVELIEFMSKLPSHRIEDDGPPEDDLYLEANAHHSLSPRDITQRPNFKVIYRSQQT